jgi:hypothetical protein
VIITPRINATLHLMTLYSVNGVASSSCLKRQLSLECVLLFSPLSGLAMRIHNWTSSMSNELFVRT